MRLIVAGTRTYNDVENICDLLNGMMEEGITEIISGGATGPDTIGELWAKDRNIPVKRFLPDWNTHGKAAGPIRNRQMAENADTLLCFWDGKSRGTKNMIDTAQKLGLSTFTVMV